MMWSSSVRSILKGWLGVKVLMRSSAVTTGDSLDAEAPAAEVHGSKSYIEVSMSAKRMSSRARSVRKPEEEEEDGKVFMSKPLVGRVSITLGSVAAVPVVNRSTANGLGPSTFELQDLVQFLESEAVLGWMEDWRGMERGTVSEEVVIDPAAVDDGHSSSISSRAEEKLSAAIGGRSLDGE